MKKLVMIAGLALAFMSSVAVGVFTDAQTINAASRCTVKVLNPDGPIASSEPRGQKFTTSGSTSSVKFRVEGPNNCKVQVSTASFYAPSQNGKPYDAQVEYQKKTKYYTKGTYTSSVQLPKQSTKQKGCFYQVDLYYGTQIKKPVLAYGHGKLPCGEQPKKIKVCDLATKTPITILEKNFDREKHSRDFDDCKEEPKMIEVCLIEEKERVNIREDQYDSSIHTKDFSVCDETPETPEPPKPEEPVEEVPAEMPETGPMQAVAQMLGAGSLVASAGYYLQSRRQ